MTIARIAKILMLATISIALLLITGILNADFFMAYLGLALTPNDVAAKTIQQTIEAYSRKDFTTLAQIGKDVIQSVLSIYLVSYIFYIVGFTAIIYWATPKIKSALSSLSSSVVIGEIPEGDLSKAQIKNYIVQVLRGRATRKRVEAYGALGVALFALIVGIGFITRGTVGEPPIALKDEAIDVGEIESNVSGKISDIQNQIEDHWLKKESSAGQVSNSNIELILELAQRSSIPATAKLNEPVGNAIKAVVENDVASRNNDLIFLAGVAKDQLGLASAQLKVIDKAVSFEFLQQTVFAVTAKVGALIIILLLAKILVEIYSNCIQYATDYDAGADFIQLCPDNVLSNPDVLRAALKPDYPRMWPHKKMPSSLLDAMTSKVNRSSPNQAESNLD